MEEGNVSSQTTHSGRIIQKPRRFNEFIENSNLSELSSDNEGEIEEKEQDTDAETSNLGI